MKISEEIQDWLVIIISAIAIILMFFFYTPTTRAQNVTRNGNTFVQKDSSSKIKKDNPTLTKYYYQTIDGTRYPIYMSASGKCFIIKTSKNGKQYKQYLPEISKRLLNDKKS